MIKVQNPNMLKLLNQTQTLYIFVNVGPRIWSIPQLIQWSSIVRIIWHVEAIVTMVAQLWYNYGILILQSLIYLSLQVTLYVPSPFVSMYVWLLEVNGGLTYLCHSTLLPLKSTLLATLSLQVIYPFCHMGSPLLQPWWTVFLSLLSICRFWWWDNWLIWHPYLFCS